MTRQQIWSYYIRATRLIFGGCFLYAGLVKFGHEQEFADKIVLYQIMPNILVSPLAFTIPVMEVMLGGVLLSGWRIRSSLFGATTLLLIFVLTLFQAGMRGLVIDCGCFGNEAVSPSGVWFAFFRDTVFLAFVGVAYLGSYSIRKAPGQTTGTI